MSPRRVNPPHYFLIALTAMLASKLLPGPTIVAGPWRYAGLPILLTGIVVAFAAARRFAAAGTNIVPLTRSSAIVTDGPFARSRNPMYLGMTLSLTGVALLLGTAWPWLVLPVFVAVLYYRFIRFEEVLMAQTFGDAYLQYKRRVRRWI